MIRSATPLGAVAPADPSVVCPDCGTRNNQWVNPRRCWKCGHEWGADDT